MINEDCGLDIDTFFETVREKSVKPEVIESEQLTSDYKNIYVEGNKGGDFLEITTVSSDGDDDVVHLRIGHCCVYYLDIEVPVAVLTSMIGNYFNHNKNVKPMFDEKIDWPKEYKEKLKGLIKYE